MKTTLIKIGKAVSVLKRDGFANGLKTLFRFILMFVKTLTTPVKGDVLIITAGIGDSAVYRAFNQAEELNLNGIKTSVMLMDHPFLPKFADKCKVFIFHRTMVTSQIAKLIERIKTQKKEIIFETDDLVFDPKFIQKTDFFQNKMNAGERLQYQKGAGEEIINDPYVKACTTTTTFLAKVLESYGKKVFVVKNKISNQELGIAEDVIGNIPNERQDNVVRIGYFSGTSSHNKDFATIVNALDEVMGKFKTVRLYLGGPLDVDSNLAKKYADRIVILPFVPREKYYENIWKVDINLAPLVLGDPFCEAKSEIKFIEAGILGIPTVAVKNQTYSEAINDGGDGFLAGDDSEWIEKLSTLIKDSDLRKMMGRQAREKVLRKYTNKNIDNSKYYEYLKSKV